MMMQCVSRMLAHPLHGELPAGDCTPAMGWALVDGRHGAVE